MQKYRNLYALVLLSTAQLTACSSSPAVHSSEVSRGWSYAKAEADGSCFRVELYAKLDGEASGFGTETVLPDGAHFFGSGLLSDEELASFRALSTESAIRAMAPNYLGVAGAGAIPFPEKGQASPMFQYWPQGCAIGQEGCAEHSGPVNMEPVNPQVTALDAFFSEFAKRHRGEKHVPAGTTGESSP